jgi:hypothetical protein
MNAAGFEWDSANLPKCQKHGVTIAEIEAVFQFPHHLAPDVLYSTVETRFLAIGRGGGTRPVFVAFTLRHRGDKTFIRPISARFMHDREIAHYDKTASRSDQ